MRAARLAMAMAVAVGLAGCSYAYRNPAEQLGPGEVGGRTVAGIEVVVDGVAVAVKGAGLDATSRANGRFAMLPLPVGKHTLMFRKGKDRALQRDVEIAWGKDGQPQGLWMGDVTVPATVGLRGSCEVPSGAALAENGIAVDEVSGAAVPVDASSGEFGFDGLSVGQHRVRVYATDAHGVPYVGGPAEVTFLDSDAGTLKRLSRLALHPASADVARRSSVTLRFAVAGAVPGLSLGAVTVIGLPVPVTFQSDGFAQVEVPEGLFTVEVVLPGGVTGVSPPPRVSFVAVDGQTIDLGTLYAVSDAAASQAASSCHADADCAPGTCSQGRCTQWTPPVQAPASVPWCNLDALGCRAGTPLGGVQNVSGGFGPPYTMTCAAYDGGTQTVGVACGASCTPDGVAVVTGEPGKGGCPSPAAPGTPTAWSSVASGTTSQLNAIWGSSAYDAWAVGELGTILHWDGVAWSSVASGTQAGLWGVWGSAPDDVWAVGDLGTILHWNGSAWTSTLSQTAEYLAGVWGASPTEVWAVGNNGLILRWNGLAWASVQNPMVYAVRGVWGSAADDVWAAGASTILHWDGTAWTSATSLSSGLLTGWSAGSKDVWAVGYYGATQHGDGSTWTAVPNMESGLEDSVTGVWGSAGDDVWAVADSGGVQRWNGAAWSSVPSASPFPLQAIWGSAADDVWAVGKVGAIVHWSWNGGGPATHAISGSVGGAVYGGVNLTLQGASASATVETSGGGAFNFGGLADGSYTLTPSLAGYSFSPPSLQVVVKGASVSGQSFAATAVTSGFTISGTVSGAVAAGVQIWISGPTVDTGVYSDAAGAYAFAGLPAGTYTLSAYASGYTLTPASLQVLVSGADVAGRDFVAALPACVGCSWQWQHPLPQGNQVNGLWGSVANDAWAVASAGTILHWDGAAWSPMASGTTSDLLGVWGASATDVWAVGKSGAALHWDGVAWSLAASGTANDLTGVWGSAGGDIWAVGAGTIQHWNGSAWSTASTGAVQFAGVWGSASNDVWAVGNAAGGTIAHWDGVAWSTGVYSSAYAIYGVWGTAANDVWAAGQGGWTYHWNGTQWLGVISAEISNLVTGWSSAANDAWVGGNYSLQHGNGTTWLRSTLAPPGNVRAMWGSAPTDLWAAGEAGNFYHWNGTGWTTWNPGAWLQQLNGVWASSPTEGWAVGAAGTLLHWNGTAWSLVTGSTSFTLTAVWGSSASDVWATGWFGNFITHWDGTGWTNVAAPSAAGTYLLGLSGTGPVDAWAVGYGGTILHWGGSAWSSVTSGATGGLTAVWARTPSDAWAVGYSDLLHWNGTAWSATTTVPSTYALAVWGSAANDVWAVGQDQTTGLGSIIHWDGTVWTAASGTFPAALHGVTGSSSSDVWAVGGQGTVHHWDGTAWSLLPNLTANGLYSAFALGGSDVLAVGADVTILGYRP
jgi:hypothetical protein